MKETCSECGGPAKTADLERHGCCFRCKVSGLGWFFHGGGRMHNRGAFHERTNAEAEREILDGAKRQGVELQRKK